MSDEFFHGLLTPEDIAARINASAGTSVSPRSVWEKARRVGVARKVGKAKLVHVDDIPRLLAEEKTRAAPPVDRKVSASNVIKEIRALEKARVRARKKKKPKEKPPAEPVDDKSKDKPLGGALPPDTEPEDDS